MRCPQGPQGRLQVGPPTGVHVGLGIDHLAAPGYREQPTLLPGVALERALPEPAPHGLDSGQDGAQAKCGPNAPDHPQRLVHATAGIGVDGAVRRLFALEGPGLFGGAVADEEQLRAGRVNLVELSAQLRGGLGAVQSAVVAQEGKDQRPAGRQVGEPDLMALGIEDGQIGGQHGLHTLSLGIAGMAKGANRGAEPLGSLWAEE